MKQRGFVPFALEPPPAPPAFAGAPAPLTAEQHSRIADYWQTLGRFDRRTWFNRAGFHFYYSAAAWPVLVDRVPETASAVGNLVIEAEFSLDESR